MKVAIISDIHDNLVNLKKFLHWAKENVVEQIFCTGDVTNNESLEVLGAGFESTIHLVKGNVEIYHEADLKKFKNIKYYGKLARIEVNKKIIGLCHEPFLIEKVLKLGPCDLVFYGHTHKPWETKVNRTKAINPGTLGGVFTKATFAIWDTAKDEVELKILELL